MDNSTILNNDYKVADLSLAGYGRKEVELAESEMPALMKLRAQYKESQPLAGANILGCIHITIQTAVLMQRFGGHPAIFFPLKIMQRQQW